MLGTDFGKTKAFGPRSRDLQWYKAITVGQI